MSLTVAPSKRVENDRKHHVRTGLRAVATSHAVAPSKRVEDDRKPLIQRLRTWYMTKRPTFRPIVVNCSQAAIIAGAADATNQLLQRGAVEMLTLLRPMVMMGFFCCPLSMAIYALFDRIQASVLVRVLLDQFVFGWVTIHVQMSVMHILTGHPLRSLPPRIFSDEIIKTVIASWVVWCPAKAIIFGLVPTSHRLLAHSSVGFFWQLYISIRYNS